MLRNVQGHIRGGMSDFIAKAKGFRDVGEKAGAASGARMFRKGYW